MDATKFLTTVLVASAAITPLIAQGQVSSSEADSIVYQELEFPLEYKRGQPFIYLNDEWIPNEWMMSIEAKDVISINIKADEWENKAAYVYVSDDIARQVKEKFKDYNMDSLRSIEPLCIYPGGNGRLQDWIRKNTVVPDDFDGYSIVLVGFKVSPDGSVSDAKILRGSRTESVNREALRVVGTLPKFIVEFPTPKNHPFYFSVPVHIQTPGKIYIR